MHVIWLSVRGKRLVCARNMAISEGKSLVCACRVENTSINYFRTQLTLRMWTDGSAWVYGCYN